MTTTVDFNKKVEKAFEKLNDRLKAENITLKVICAGGYVLSHYGLRTTRDVDGFFRSSASIERAIKDTGDELSLNTEDELWLNNSVQNLNSCPPEKVCRAAYEYSNLTVLMPQLEYIAGMKLKSAREQDISDVADMIKILKAEDPIKFSKDIEALGFSGIDESLILEAFAKAYGMKWLEKYYTEHEKEVIAWL